MLVSWEAADIRQQKVAVFTPVFYEAHTVFAIFVCVGLFVKLYCIGGFDVRPHDCVQLCWRGCREQNYLLLLHLFRI